jgi:hypothetical protein
MISLEHLADGSLADRNFLTLTKLVLDTGGKSIGVRFGTSSATWTASAQSANKAIAHGLGHAPVAVMMTGYNNLIWANVSRDATNIVIAGISPGGAITGTFNVDWLAIG